MKTGHAVIGCNYGDEGKGLITDYLVSRLKTPETALVVRFNGGAQAGHTVETPDGRRHVFSHFGAGSFQHCPTYLSQFFVVNPILFTREHALLGALKVEPVTYISERALLTTPIDMFINQIIENHRGGQRHGSCGIGINETVTRCRRAPELCTRTLDLKNLGALKHKLEILASHWLPLRLNEFGVDVGCPDVQRFLERKRDIMAEFIHDAEMLMHRSILVSQPPSADHVIFEGAQGLLLDEDRIDQWPHVTHSKTGLFNVRFLAEQMKLEKLQATYVTRTYLTRHGAGTLAGEAGWSFPDRTNIPNNFQGSLRFAPLDTVLLQRSIDLDMASNKFEVEADIAMTCCDQSLPQSQLNLNIPIRYLSFGPSRSNLIVQNGALDAQRSVHAISELFVKKVASKPRLSHVERQSALCGNL